MQSRGADAQGQTDSLLDAGGDEGGDGLGESGRRVHQDDSCGGRSGEGMNSVEIQDLVKNFGKLRGGGSRFAGGGEGRDFRLPGAQRRGEIDHHPHAVRPVDAERGERIGERVRRGAAARGDPPHHRVHVAEVLALRRFDGGGEHRFLHGNLRRPAGEAGGAQELRAGDGRPDGAAQRADAHALRRVEAAAGAGLRDPARSAGVVPGRADFRRGPAGARRVLGVDPRSFGDGPHDLRQHALYG